MKRQCRTNIEHNLFPEVTLNFPLIGYILLRTLLNEIVKRKSFFFVWFRKEHEFCMTHFHELDARVLSCDNVYLNSFNRGVPFTNFMRLTTILRKWNFAASHAASFVNNFWLNLMLINPRKCYRYDPQTI